MMVIAIAASVGLTGAGCATRGGNGVAMAVGGLVAVTGVAVNVSSDRPANLDPSAVEFNVTPVFGAALIVAGVTLALVGGLGLLHVNDGEGDGAAAATPSSDDDGRLDRLALRALDAARVRDCGAVRTTIDSILLIDGDYYRTTLARDPLIVACLRR